MFKKIISILLSITLLLTLCPVTGVFAESTVTVGTLTEDFDGMTKTDEYFAFKNSQLDDHLFFKRMYKETDTFNRNDPAYKIVEKEGADGKTSKMLEMMSPVYTTSVTPVALALPSYTAADNTAKRLLKYSYDLYIEEIPSDNTGFKSTYPYFAMFYYNTSGTLASNSANFDSKNFVIENSYNSTKAKGAKLEAGNWYRVEMSAGSVEGSCLNCSIYDKLGTKIYEDASAETGSLNIFTNTSRKNSSGHNRLLASPVLTTVTEEGKGFKVLIDNAEYRVCLPASEGPELKTGSYFTEPTIKSGDTVATTVDEVTVAFDQKLKEGFNATLTPAGGTPIECTMTAGNVYASSSFFTVDLSGKLAAGTDYTLSFENCTNSDGASATGSIKFKTEGGASEKASISDVNANGKNKDDEVTFVYNATVDGTVSFIAAFYDEKGNLVGVEIPEENVAVGNNDIEIILSADYNTAEKVGIFAWDNFDKITPLAETGWTDID